MKAEAASHPAVAYRAAVERHGRAASDLDARARKVEVARLVTFLLGAVAILVRNDLPLPTLLSEVVGVVALVVFVALVVRHRRLRRALRRERAREGLARLGLARLARDWAAVAADARAMGYTDPLLEPMGAAAEDHPYAYDLDVFGPGSVRALLGPTPTPSGTETLRAWLSAPASPEAVRSRQGAVRELATEVDAREELAVEALQIDRVDRARWSAFLDWTTMASPFGAEGEDGVPTWAVPFSRVAPLVTLALLVAWSFSVSLPALVWVVPLALQATLAYRWARRLGGYFGPAGASSPGLRRHYPLFAAWESYEAEDGRIRALQGRLGVGDGLRASSEIRTLERWLDLASSQGSMFHQIVAAAFLWDVHVAVGLERWRARAGAHVPDWFEALGELEALAALATMAYDHPDWCFPELRAGVPGLEADALGHPLLPDDVRRTSDVRLDPPGRFLLVTGSNMSGKSTLLRSIGLAAVLGQAGSVVCAQRASMTSLRTFTSMRIHDSLTSGVSLFMAELIRLKALVDASHAPESSPALLYLIDEVLQGTNSEERRVAARRIVRHLLASHAIGAVTTHDLALHEDPDLDPASTKVHFRETVDESAEHVLTFDYVLRPGLATSRNALRLLRIVGLEEATDTDGTAGRG